MQTFQDRMVEAWRMLEDQEKVRRLTLPAGAKLLKDRVGLDIDASTISKWLNGSAVPSLEKIVAFAKLVDGVDPGWLAFGKESRAPGPGEMGPYYPTQPRKG